MGLGGANPPRAILQFPSLRVNRGAWRDTVLKTGHFYIRIGAKKTFLFCRFKVIKILVDPSKNPILIPPKNVLAPMSVIFRELLGTHEAPILDKFGGPRS